MSNFQDLAERALEIRRLETALADAKGAFLRDAKLISLEGGASDSDGSDSVVLEMPKKNGRNGVFPLVLHPNGNGTAKVKPKKKAPKAKKPAAPAPKKVPSKPPRRFTKDQVADLVARAKTLLQEKSLTVVARELDVGETSLRSWLRKAKISIPFHAQPKGVKLGERSAYAIKILEKATADGRKLRTIEIGREVLKKFPGGKSSPSCVGGNALQGIRTYSGLGKKLLFDEEIIDGSKRRLYYMN
jgi:transposase-like protein